MQNFDRALLSQCLRYCSFSHSAKLICIWLAIVSTFTTLFVETSAWAQPVPSKSKDDPNPETLPPGFRPPPNPLAIMELEKPIATKEELAKLKRDAWNRFSKVKTDCDMSATGKKVVEGSIRYRLGSLTAVTLEEMRKDPNLVSQIHRSFIQEISNIGGPQKSPAQNQAMAKFVNDEVLKQIPELLKNNFYVRLHAVLILSEMDYAPAFKLLLEVLQAKDIHEDENDGQPDALKIAAVNGLIRIVRFAQAPVATKVVIANAIVEQLENKNLYWWFQMRMVEFLRYCGITGVNAGNNNKPFVVDSLLSIIRDKDRDWRVRAKACYAMGRVPFGAGVKPDEVVSAVSEFALQLVTAATANLANPIWKGCFWDLYLAFKPNDTPRVKDLDCEEKRPAGLLNVIKPAAQPAYDLIVPIVSDVLAGKAPDPASMQKLNQFVQARQLPGNKNALRTVPGDENAIK